MSLGKRRLVTRCNTPARHFKHTNSNALSQYELRPGYRSALYFGGGMVESNSIHVLGEPIAFKASLDPVQLTLRILAPVKIFEIFSRVLETR